MKKFIAFMLLAALVLTAFVGCSSSDGKDGGASGPDAAVKSYVSTLYSNTDPSKSAVKSLKPAKMWEEAGNFDDAYEEFLDERAYYIEMAAGEYGEDYKVTCEILSKEKMSAEELEEGREGFEEYYGLDGKKLTEAYNVEFEITFKGSEGEESIIQNAIAYKYDGAWYAESD